MFCQSAFKSIGTSLTFSLSPNCSCTIYEFLFANLCRHCIGGEVEGVFVLGCFDSSVNNPRTSSSTPSQKYLICYGPNKKQNNSSQIEDVYDKTWACQQQFAPQQWSAAWLLCSCKQLLIQFDPCFFLLPELPVEPFPFQVKQRRPSGALPLHGVIPGSHLPVSHTSSYQASIKPQLFCSWLKVQREAAGVYKGFNIVLHKSTVIFYGTAALLSCLLWSCNGVARQQASSTSSYTCAQKLVQRTHTIPSTLCYFQRTQIHSQNRTD